MASITPSGEEVIRRPSEKADYPIPSEALLDVFDIATSADWIGRNGWRVVGLQFPDELLPYSIPILRLLRQRLASCEVSVCSTELYIMADTTYGSCCVDEVAAQHVQAEAVVHYGNACMSSTSRLPVLYVFPKAFLDEARISTLSESLVAAFMQWHSCASVDEQPREVQLLHDVAYDWDIDRVHRALQDRLHLPLKLQQLQKDSLLATSSAAESTRPEAIFYIGGMSRHLTAILLVHSLVPAWAVDPTENPMEARLQSVGTNKLLMRRYGTLQRARDADTVGIAVGTLGVKGYLPALTHLRTLIACHGKKSYTAAVGKLRPEKLANFADIEAWVLLACPENTLLEGIGRLTGREYPVPIITPFELEIALKSGDGDDRTANARWKWDGTYVLDFDTIWQPCDADEGTMMREAAGAAWQNVPIFSTATGKLKTRRVRVRRASSEHDEDGLDISSKEGSRAMSAALDSPAQAFLARRTFRGLDHTEPAKPAIVGAGRSGIARSYCNEQGQ